MDKQDHIIMFNQVGQMASSMAYIHATIPQKSIKDMAFFATKRLNKLASKLRTIHNVLPDDN